MRISKVTLLLILVAACVLVSVIGALLFQRWYVVDVKSIPIEVTVTNTSLLGFNTGTDKLYFGTTNPGGISDRTAAIVTSYESIVTVSVAGQVDGWVSVSENNIRMIPNEPRDIRVRLRVPENATPGNYTGAAIITYKRALPWQ
jgi:hypothetical protein